MYKCSRKMVVCCLLTAFVALMGCNREVPPKVESESKVFETASAEVKDQWNKILTAATTNDYSTAVIGCRKLLTNQDLTQEQRGAINTTQAAVTAKMTDAAQKGDAAALQAVADIRKAWR